jgi:hypothetical protein
MQGNHSGANLADDIRGWHGHGVDAARVGFGVKRPAAVLSQVLDNVKDLNRWRPFFIYSFQLIKRTD